MNKYQIIDKNTGKVIATEEGYELGALELVKKYDLAGRSQQHLKLVRIS